MEHPAPVGAETSPPLHPPARRPARPPAPAPAPPPPTTSPPPAGPHPAGPAGRAHAMAAAAASSSPSPPPAPSPSLCQMKWYPCVCGLRGEDSCGGSANLPRGAEARPAEGGVGVRGAEVGLAGVGLYFSGLRRPLSAPSRDGASYAARACASGAGAS